MALSWNEIKDRALKFSNECAKETKERAEKDTFWNDFFMCLAFYCNILSIFLDISCLYIK